MHVAIIIPAYNEEKRITRTLHAYIDYFNNKIKKDSSFNYNIIVSLNGCTDHTESIVQEVQKTDPHITYTKTVIAGKGLAITHGFLHALRSNATHIGFVDADMATEPYYFDELINNIGNNDGIIASRYMPQSKTYPPRPFIKEWGRKIIYNNLVRLLFGISFYDYQCGAKLFKKEVIAIIANHLHVTQWAFDIELLYLCHKNHCTIIEIPTTWHDQSGSSFKPVRSGLPMIKALFSLWYKQNKKN